MLQECREPPLAEQTNREPASLIVCSIRSDPFDSAMMCAATLQHVEDRSLLILQVKEFEYISVGTRLRRRSVQHAPMETLQKNYELYIENDIDRFRRYHMNTPVVTAQCVRRRSEKASIRCCVLLEKNSQVCLVQNLRNS